MRTTTIRKQIRLPAPPGDVYAALMNSKQHAKFTGAPARIPRTIGGRMTAYGGYITGSMLGLFPGRGFVQTWRTTEWPSGCEDSRLEIRLSPVGKGTTLTMIHSRVPASQAGQYSSGWKEFYWKPLREYLAAKTAGAAGGKPRRRSQ